MSGRCIHATRYKHKVLLRISCTNLQCLLNALKVKFHRGILNISKQNIYLVGVCQNEHLQWTIVSYNEYIIGVGALYFISDFFLYI